MYHSSIISIVRRGLLCSVGLLSVYLPACAQRDTVNIVDWQFSRAGLSPAQANQGSGEWQSVRLPHDFQISQPWVAPTADEHADNRDQAANVKSRLSSRGFKEMGKGWYRRTFTPDNSWRGRRVVLEVGGIMLVGDVWLNGERIGGTEYGYVGFGIDISSKLRYGQENVLTVLADTRGPQNSRWYTGGGLFRDVKFIVTDRQLFFDRHPLQITTTDNRKVHIRAAISNYGSQRQTALAVRILDAQGHVVAHSDTLLALTRHRHTMEYPLADITIDHPHVWDLDTPYLYSAELTLRDDSGRVADRVTEPFGIRTIEYGPSFGFKLNGRKVILKGIANHHSLGGLGAAAYERAIEKRIELIKSFGFNHIRTSHNPYSESLLKLCDHYGIIVVDELYDKWLDKYCGGRKPWSELWQENIPEFIKRDRNHACVAIWSLGNELQTYWELPYADWGVTAYRMQKELVKRYDATRPITVAMHPRGRNVDTDSLPAPLVHETDIAAYNYRYMYFPGDGRKFPNLIFYQSEANTSMMGANFFEMELDKVVGLAYWGMIDYLGESNGWPAKGWHQGIFDISLEPKPSAYYIKSYFTESPMVHIGVMTDNRTFDWNGIKVGGTKLTENWNLGDKSSSPKVTVHTYTNTEEVELRLNGKSLGIRKNDINNPKTRNKVVWNDVIWSAGKLEAIGRNGGKEVCRHEISTSGTPSKLQCTPDNIHWKADGMDLQHIRIHAVDNKNRRVYGCNSKLTFAVEGDARIVAVSNGDIYSDELNVTNERHLFDGSALVIIRSGKHPGNVKLRIQSEDFKQTELILKTE